MEKQKLEPAAVLSKALQNTASPLGMSMTDIAEVIGKDRSSIYRGINPDSKSGQLAKLFIRCYRSLFVLVGGKPEDMRHWMLTFNNHTSGIPAEQVKKPDGLARVLVYLDAMRSKI